MSETLTISAKETSALKRVENAARRVIRYPNDVAPRRSLSNALRSLDAIRKQEGKT